MYSMRPTGVTERDIDLLLAEEFLASSAFRRWFLKEIGLARSFSLLPCSPALGQRFQRRVGLDP